MPKSLIGAYVKSSPTPTHSAKGVGPYAQRKVRRPFKHVWDRFHAPIPQGGGNNMNVLSVLRKALASL